MPLYEFVCNNCNQRFEIRLTYAEYGKKVIRCHHCSSRDVRRRITRPRMMRSVNTRLADMPDPASLEGIENDPQSFGRMIRNMSNESGEDLGPEFNEVVDRLESGQSVSDIEQSMPDMEDDSSLNDNGLH